MGDFPGAGGIATVEVKFKDLYGAVHSETLSIDFDTINKNKKQFAYVTSPLDVIARRIEDIENSVKSGSDSIKVLAQVVASELSAIKNKLK